MKTIQEQDICPYCNKNALLDITILADERYIYICSDCGKQSLGKQITKCDLCDNNATHYIKHKGCSDCGGIFCGDYPDTEYFCKDCKDGWFIEGARKIRF